MRDDNIAQIFLGDMVKKTKDYESNPPMVINPTIYKSKSITKRGGNENGLKGKVIITEKGHEKEEKEKLPSCCRTREQVAKYLVDGETDETKSL